MAPDGTRLKLVGLFTLGETITAKEGWVIDVWFADRKCPECDNRGRERAGAEFQHMDRCVKCGHVWTPGSPVLRVREPTDAPRRQKIFSAVHKYIPAHSYHDCEEKEFPKWLILVVDQKIGRKEWLEVMEVGEQVETDIYTIKRIA